MRTHHLIQALTLALLTLVACNANVEMSYDFDDDGWEDHLDCGPEDASIHPEAHDPYGDGIDQDCDGSDGVDNDGDAFPSNVLQSDPDWDCNDFDETTYPGAEEICDDNADNDCDGEADEGECDPGDDDDSGDDDDDDHEWVDVAVGYNHTCGLHGDGSIECWGDGSAGQLNWPTGTFDSITSGYQHSCALAADGMGVCWGYGDEGATAIPATEFDTLAGGGSQTCGIRSDDGYPICWPEGYGTPPELEVVALDAGSAVGCAIDTTATLHCWGQPYWNTPPTQGHFIQVAVGSTAGCALTNTDTVTCWGFSQDAYPGTFLDVDAGFQMACGVMTDGSIACWGDANDYGADEPPEGSNFVDLSLGNVHGCALTDEGETECWGCGGGENYGQCDVPSS